MIDAGADRVASRCVARLRVLMIYRFAEFLLDPALRELRCGEQRIDPGPRVLELLELLLRADGRALERSALLAALWPGARPDERGLTRLVGRARAALGESGREACIIRTHPGRGYSIGVPIEVASGAVPLPALEPGASLASAGASRTELVAIVHADVAGYSRHIARDRTATAERIEVLRHRTPELVSRHGGRLADWSGDCFLATFASAERAVEFARAFHADCAEANASPETRRPLEFRVGVHLGDVQRRGDGPGEAIYGAGVNIAARLEALADPGGICVSEAVYDQVRGVLDVAWEDLGPQLLKNIDKAVTAHRTGPQRAAVETPPQSREPSFLERQAIAVLAFESLSDDPDQEFFASGIAEDLITALAARRHFPVIARNSSFAYKGRAADVREVGRELGATYVVEGTVRRAGRQLRVTVQLLNAETGHHLWARRYDREVGDVFALQDEIVADVFLAIEPELRRYAPRPRSGRLDVWELEQRAFRNINTRTDQSTRDALACLDRVLALDPDSVRAHIGRAVTLQIRVTSAWDADPGRLEESLASARRAVALDPSHPWARGALGDALAMLGRLDEARPEIERAIELDPSSAIAYWQLGRLLSMQGDHRAAAASVENALRLSPRDPLLASFLNALAQAQFGAGLYEESLATARRSLGAQEGIQACCVALACAGLLERGGEARELCARAQRIVPGLDLAQVEAFLTARGTPDSINRPLLRGLRLAGLPAPAQGERQGNSQGKSQAESR